MLRALLALTDAQLRQSDYLSMPEVEALRCSRIELEQTLRLPVVPLECCGSCKPNRHFPTCRLFEADRPSSICLECGSTDVIITAGVKRCRNCQKVQSVYVP